MQQIRKKAKGSNSERVLKSLEMAFGAPSYFIYVIRKVRILLLVCLQAIGKIYSLQ